MMIDSSLREFDVERLFLAIEALQGEGYTLWLLDDDSEGQYDVDVLQLVFEHFPEDAPILDGELELLAQVFREIMMLGNAPN